MPYLDNDAGFKRGKTSHDAAKSAPTHLRALVLECFRVAGPMTADECANRLELDILSVRPRVSELRNNNLLDDSGNRGITNRGKTAVIWKAVSSHV